MNVQRRIKAMFLIDGAGGGGGSNLCSGHAVDRASSEARSRAVRIGVFGRCVGMLATLFFWSL